jgi:hypothetical protein
MLWLANTLRLNPGLKLKFSPRGQSMFGRQVRREKIEEDLRTLCRVIVEKEDVWVEKLRAARLVFTTKTNTWALQFRIPRGTSKISWVHSGTRDREAQALLLELGLCRLYDGHLARRNRMFTNRCIESTLRTLRPAIYQEGTKQSYEFEATGVKEEKEEMDKYHL